MTETGNIRFLSRNWRWLSGAMLLTLMSCFGQTFFISLFSSPIRAEFGLTHGSFGFLYMMMTLLSAVTIIWLGRLVDVYSIRNLAIVVILVTAIAALLAGASRSLFLFAVALYLLRFFGQGMLDHISIVAMARWYDSHRGRALSIASLGHPFGEAILPIAGVALMTAVGWRETWFLIGALLILAGAPVIFRLLRKVPPAEDEAHVTTTRHSRPKERSGSEVARDPLFYGILAGTLSHAFITTGIFFHQVQIAEAKGWSIAWLAANYPVYAGLTVGVSLVVGGLIDKWSARALLPLGLLPLSVACLALCLFSHPFTMTVFMALVGLSSGIAGPVMGALWPEIYGRQSLGAIRSFTMAGNIFASALAPGLMGWLFDIGVPVGHQMIFFTIYTLAASLLLAALLPTLNRVAMAGEE